MNVHILKVNSLVAVFFTILAAVPAPVYSSQDSKIVDQYRKAIELNPTDSGLRYSLGLSLLQNGRYAEAVQELDLLYPQREEDPDMNFNLAYAHLQLKNYDRAYELFSKVESLGVGNGKKYRLESAFLQIAMNYRQMGLSEKAVTCLSKSISIDPNNVKNYLFLADMYLKNGENEKALDALEDARAIDEGNEDIIAMISNTHTRVGLAYLANKQYLEARQEFSNALEVDSSSLYAIYYLGYLEYIEKNIETAAYHLAKLTALSIEDENLKKGLKPLLFNIGLYYIQSNQPEKGLQLMDKLLILFPTYSKALYYSGVASMESGAYGDAIDKLELYLKDSPDDSSAASRLGLAYEKSVAEHMESGQLAYYRKDFRQALTELDKVLSVSPEHEKANNLKNLVSAELKKIEGEERKEALKLISATLKDVSTLLDEGELSAARDKLLEAKKVAPSNQEVETSLGKVSAKISEKISKSMKSADLSIKGRDYSGAIRHYRSVLSLDAANIEAAKGLEASEKELDKLIVPLLSRADSFMKKEMFLDAYKTYENALVIDPANEDAKAGRGLSGAKVDSLFKEYLGMARDYAGVKQNGLASSYYKKALELRPGDETALRESSQLDRNMGRVRSIAVLLQSSEKNLNSGEINSAISGFSDVLKLEPENNAAKNGLKQALAIRAKKVDNMIAKADLLFEEGKYAEVIDLGKKIIILDKGSRKAQNLLQSATLAVDSKVTPYLEKGKSLFDSGNMSAAIVLFQKALRADPGNLVAKRYLSKVDSNQREEAVSKAIKKNYLDGLSAYTKGKYEVAMEEWTKVLELDPDHEKATLNLDKVRRKLAAIKGR